MASKAAAVLVSFLFVLALFASPQVEARESKFFSKVTRHMSRTTAEGPSSGHPEAQAYASAPAPEPESGMDDGYGLYGHGSEEFSTTTTTGSKTQVAEEELMNESYKEMEKGSNGYSNVYNQNNVYTGEKEGMSDTRFLENGKYSYKATGKSKNYGQYSPSYTNNGYTNKYYQTNEYTPEQQEVVADARYDENGYNYKNTYDANEYSTSSAAAATTTNHKNGYTNKYYQTNEYTPEQREVVADARYDENGYNYKNTNDANEYSTSAAAATTTSNNKNGYQVEQQGMSDTRFINNGEYFYDLENEKKENNYHDGYTTEEKESNSHEVYYPNTKNSGEFYNQYQGQQQEYQEAPEEYVP